MSSLLNETQAIAVVLDLANAKIEVEFVSLGIKISLPMNQAEFLAERLATGVVELRHKPSKGELN